MKEVSFINLRNDCIISYLKKEKYNFGLSYIPRVYLQKYIGKQLINKLCRFLNKLTKWKDAINYRFNWYDTHEAQINNQDIEYEKYPFIENLYEIEQAIEYIDTKINIFQKG